MRRALALAVAVAVVLLAAAPAQALPVLAEGDAAELAQSLADATETQGVCYGWSVTVEDQSGGESGTDAGSGTGPGVPVDRSCAKWAELQGQILYTCESCDADDSSFVAVEANFRGGPTTEDLERLGFSGGDLVAEDNDVVLSNMVGALPLITASNGAAEPVPGPTTAEADKPAAGDGPTGTPSLPDWLRESWLPLAVFLLLALCGLVWLVRQVQDDRQERRARATPVIPHER